MNEKLEDFYLTQPEPQRGTLLVLRDIILAHDADISETVKYGMPCFLYRRNILCYLWTDSKTAEPYILFSEGKLINDPHLEKGGRARMKILRVAPNADIPAEVIGSVLDQAIALYMNGAVRLK